MNTEHSARMALRAATGTFHDRVDRVFSKARLGDRQSYGQFLQAQAGAHIPAEAALTRAGIGSIVADWPERQRAAALMADLAELGLEAPEGAGEPVLEGEAELLGALYVLEGARLGGTLLKRSVATELPTRFLGGGDSAAWRRLLALLDERIDTEAKRLTSIKTASEIFMLFEASGQKYLKVV